MTFQTTTVQLFNKWKIGQENKNNGVLVLVAKRRPGKMWITTGQWYYEGVIARCFFVNELLNKTSVPNFKAGNFLRRSWRGNEFQSCPSWKENLQPTNTWNTGQTGKYSMVPLSWCINFYFPGCNFFLKVHEQNKYASTNQPWFFGLPGLYWMQHQTEAVVPGEDFQGGGGFGGGGGGFGGYRRRKFRWRRCRWKLVTHKILFLSSSIMKRNLLALILAATIFQLQYFSKKKTRKQKKLPSGFLICCRMKHWNKRRKDFLQRWRDHGFDDKNLDIIYRNAQNDQPTLQQACDYLVSQPVDLIATKPDPFLQSLLFRRQKKFPVFMMVSPRPDLAKLTDTSGKAPSNLFGVYEPLNTSILRWCSLKRYCLRLKR